VAAHWFRIPYARNAFMRSLSSPLASLAAADGIDAMLAFRHSYRPQHAELDMLECSWGPAGDSFEFAITRRMQRHDHPEATLSLVFAYALTPARRLEGSAVFATLRDATSTPGYRAIARATVLDRRLD
jgi:hypothetical protein